MAQVGAGNREQAEVGDAVGLRRRLTATQRKEVWQKTQGRCAYCGKPIEISQMQVDHAIPMEFYNDYHAVGKDLNALSNLLPACRSCNNYKSSYTMEKFRKAIERMPEVLQRDSVTYRNAVRFGVVTPSPHPVVFYFEAIGLPRMQEE